MELNGLALLWLTLFKPIPKDYIYNKILQAAKPKQLELG